MLKLVEEIASYKISGLENDPSEIAETFQNYNSRLN